MRAHKLVTDRIGAFSDGVIAVIITVMVLDLKAPEAVTWAALWPLWPTLISYAVSYLFIAIVWINHHHLLQFAQRATPRLIWTNFAHLFAVSLVPLVTSWVARTHLATAPVATYAAIFVCVNLAYRLFETEMLKQASSACMCPRMRRMARRRSLATIIMFALAMLVALMAPLAGLGLICGALFLCLRPEAPGSGRVYWRKHSVASLK